jgi:hypothetical protein
MELIISGLEFVFSWLLEAFIEALLEIVISEIVSAVASLIWECFKSGLSWFFCRWQARRKQHSSGLMPHG